MSDAWFVLFVILLTFICTFVLTVLVIGDIDKSYARRGFMVIDKKIYKLILVEFNDEKIKKDG